MMKNAIKKHTTYKIVSICLILTALFLPLSNAPGQAQKETPSGNTLSIQTWSDGDDSQPLEGKTPRIWVVRVHFTSRHQVDDIAAWIEPWEVNYEEGYLVVGVSQAEYGRLVAEGYEVEIDHKYTEFVNRPLELLPDQVMGIPGYTCYRTVEETFTTASAIATSYPDLAEWIDVGNSWEKNNPGGLPGYDMMVLRLTNEAISGTKPKLFIMSAVHAREYTTAELTTRFAEYLIANYDVDPDVTWLLDYTEIHLLLQSNPDGRKQAETGLSWRKNTNENYCSPTSSSRGADLNRNFEFEWGCCGGSSGYECDSTYRGPSPASEPEVQAIQNYVRSIFPDQRGSSLTDPAPDDAMGIFLDIHSYSELVLWPWGFTATVSPNGTQLQTLGRKFAYFNGYEPDQAIGLYPTDGTTDDFAYGDLGVAAYVFELGTTFFQDCFTFENVILPENMPALIYAAKASRMPYMTPAGPDALNVTVGPNIVGPGDLVTLSATINDTRYNNQNGTEPTQNIAAAAYYINTPPWEIGAIPNAMVAVDGNFNATIEDVTASIDTSGLSPGRHMIYVRGQDANGNWGAVSAVFVNIETPSVFTLTKTASVKEVVPDELFTYTLETQLNLTDTNTFTLVLTDTLPTEVSVLTETIQLDGVSAPELYDPLTHLIRYQETGTFTDTYQIGITFQVQVSSEVVSGILIVNQLNGQASISGEKLAPPPTAEVVTPVIVFEAHTLFLPVILQ